MHDQPTSQTRRGPDEIREAMNHDWEAGNILMGEIFRRGFDSYAAHVQDIAGTFALEDRTVRCIDEGTPGGIHFAGSGILADFEDAVAWMQAAAVDGVTSHTGCGAANLYAQRSGRDLSEAEKLGIEHAQRIAAALGVPYRGHITKLKRPPEYHDARVIYVDDTGTFDSDRSSGLPRGLLISRAHLNPAYALQEVEVAISITLGDHGFGERFTPASPLMLAAVRPSRSPERDAALMQIAGKFSGRVRVDVFGAPDA